MSIINNLFVGPLQLIFEVIFAFANRFFENPGFSIIFLSLAMNFLVLPLYKRADAMQAEQRDTEQRLKPGVDHIKKTFKGDERFMMLQTFYRQNNYKPTDALKGSVSLLLEIPFFIAAYKMLSHLQLLNGVEFGPIKDLGAPDQMFMIGTFAVNVLPILMTLINVISGIIYTKGMSKQSKIQLFGMAAIFLVLLYNSPAGLVFYWTLNNVFSLVKNIFYKIKNPKLVLGVLSSICGVGILAAGLFVHPMDTTKKTLAVILFAVALQLPIIIYFFNKNPKAAKEVIITKKDNISFFLGGLFVSLLTGLLIPSSVIKTSPEEFISIVLLNNPAKYLLSSLSIAIGTFIVWFGIFYMLASNKGKKIMNYSMWLLAGVGTVNYMAFGKNYGNLNSKLSFDSMPIAANREIAINIVVMLVVVAIMSLLWKYRATISNLLYVTVCIAAVGMSVYNIYEINKAVEPKLAEMEIIKAEQPNFTLDKKGKNVIVLMMDRAINGYIPYIFNEKPEVAKQFEGFTYYPNTMSFGAYTNTGAPSLYGGYEYTPTEMDKRSDELLCDKHNEALKVMPEMFDENGFDVTVCDPTYAGYSWIPDLSIYSDHPDIKTYITNGKFDENNSENAETIKKNLERDFFFYSIFKISPVFLQPTIYSNGLYNNPDLIYAFQLENSGQGGSKTVQIRDGLSKSNGLDYTFMGPYSILKALPNITNISDKGNNTFLMMSNDSTHQPMLLQEPYYVPSMNVDNTKYDAEHQDRFTLNGRTLGMDYEQQVLHYHVNVASMIELGKWLDYLRANDVYDNTKIIIVADHGRNLKQFDDMILGDGESDDIMYFNPLLMVKDFDSKEFTVDETFMTNADTPTIAAKDVIDNPVNPTTNKPINSAPKSEATHDILLAPWNVNENNGKQYIVDQWYRLQGDNIFDTSKWSKVEH